MCRNNTNFSKAGFFDTKPVKQVKESRKLDTEMVVDVLEDQQQLYEVTGDAVPNVLTNDPTFFTSRDSGKMSKEDRKTRASSCWNRIKEQCRHT